MREYMDCSACLMRFLQQALDDPNSDDCGQCVNCAPEKLLPTDVDPVLLQQALVYLRRNYQPIEPRKRWPMAGMFQTYPWGRQKTIIPPELQASQGLALSLWLDGGWGQKVVDGRFRQGRFDNELVDACADMVRNWNFAQQADEPGSGEPPKWVTCVPSLRSGSLVPDFAARLAAALNLPFKPRIRKIIDNPPQEVMENAYRQAANLDGAFALDIPPAPRGQSYAPCLLVDDIVRSRWTLTVVAAALRQVGCRAVYPLALTLKID